MAQPWQVYGNPIACHPEKGLPQESGWGNGVFLRISLVPRLQYLCMVSGFPNSVGTIPPSVAPEVN